MCIRINISLKRAAFINLYKPFFTSKSKYALFYGVAHTTIKENSIFQKHTLYYTSELKLLYKRYYMQ